MQIDSPSVCALGWTETALNIHLDQIGADDALQEAAGEAERVAEYGRIRDIADKALASGASPSDLLAPAVPHGADWPVILAVVYAVEDRAWARGFEAARTPYELPF